MILWRALQQAVTGWLAILRGNAGWRDYFTLSLPGLVAALAIFLLAGFISIVLSALNLGVPTLPEFIGIMLVQSFCIVSLLIGTAATRAAVPGNAPLLPILVPGIYAMVFYLLLGAVVSLIFGPLLPLLWVGLIYLMFRLGRAAGGWTIGVSAAFAFLTVVLLVGLPMTLYMLGNVSN